MSSDTWSRSEYNQQMTVYITEDMHDFLDECEDIDNFSQFCRNRLKEKMVEEGDQSDLMEWAVNNL